MTSNLSNALRGFLQEAKQYPDYEFHIYAEHNGIWSVSIEHRTNMSDQTIVTNVVLAAAIVRCLGDFAYSKMKKED